MQVSNLDRKRVCDISEDRRTITIRRGECETTIHLKIGQSIEISNRRVRKHSKQKN